MVGAATGAIGASGEVGEEALRNLVGGQSQVYFRTSLGGRFVDQLAEGIAHESKVGYTGSGSSFTERKTAPMTYSKIQPPFTLKFREMSKADLVAYAAWFKNSIPGRIAELSMAVKTTAGFETWEANAAPDSLEALGRWLQGQVETRTKSPDEIEEARAKLIFPVELSDNQLTDRTISLAIDIGMYFAQVVLTNLPGTRWDQPLAKKNFAEYGQPVIMGFGTVPLNPVRIIVTTVYGISRKKPPRLRELYDTWARMRR